MSEVERFDVGNEEVGYSLQKVGTGWVTSGNCEYMYVMECGQQGTLDIDAMDHCKTAGRQSVQVIFENHPQCCGFGGNVSKGITWCEPAWQAPVPARDYGTQTSRCREYRECTGCVSWTARSGDWDKDACVNTSCCVGYVTHILLIVLKSCFWSVCWAFQVVKMPDLWRYQQCFSWCFGSLSSGP